VATRLEMIAVKASPALPHFRGRTRSGPYEKLHEHRSGSIFDGSFTRQHFCLRSAAASDQRLLQTVVLRVAPRGVTRR
jgi:hypothetical protein